MAIAPLLGLAQTGIEGLGPRVTSLVRGDFPAVALGVLFMAAGAFALAAHFLRTSRSPGRPLLWFGLFAGLYGLRLLAKTSLVWLLMDVGPGFWIGLVAAIDYLILVPAVLFMEELYGKGWRGSVRLLVWLFAVYAGAAILLGLVLGDPSAAPDPAVGLLFLMPALLLAGHAAGYRPPKFADAGVLLGGFAVFILTVVNEHLVNAGWAPWRVRVEVAGFLVLTVCMGYVAVRRFVVNEKQLLAVEQEMKSASRIQASILPSKPPMVKGLRVAARYAPMAAVGGDFYGFVPADDGKLGILLADVMGHGVPAALVASMIRVCLAGQAKNASDPGRVISELNEMLFHQVPGNYCTACFLFLDSEKGTATYAAAGHPPLLVCNAASRAVTEHEDNGLMLGVRPGQPYANLSIDLRPGDRLLLYTDGVVEAANPAEEFFGAARLKDFISSRQDLPAEPFVDALLEAVARWTGRSGPAARQDDLTVAAVDLLP